ncbi:MAG TPA: alpha/beta hydrolase [Geminicoccaceae bacterium]|nr:alpha/beta hydrolase [Geminicoccus sp.]HMU48271.1 alpha/beta hydrolase [Geminicoccaceae bacterium]
MYPLLGGAILYGLAIGGLYLAQDALLFPRSIAERPTLPRPPDAERLELEAAGGDRLVGTFVPARQPSRGLLIGFGGNAWNADDLAAYLARRAAGLDVVAFHYRGYAPSQGSPGEAAFFADALMIHDHLVERLQPRRVLGAGFSLGSGVLAYLAARRRLDGVVLVTPFDSIEAVAASRYFWAPVRPLLRHPFRSDRHLRDVEVPAAVIMAAEDNIVPRERSEALVEVLARPVMVATVPGTHNGIYETEAMDSALRRAFDALMPAG